MARDSGSDDKSGDKSSKRRWGRGKTDEGPSDDELGWLADLRGARDTRAPLGADEPTGSIGRRGRRGATAEPPPPPPAPPPAAPPAPGKGRKGAVPPVVAPPDVPPAPTSGRRGRRAEPPPPPPPPPVAPPPPVVTTAPPPPPPPPVAPAAATGAPSTTRRTGLRRTPSMPPPPVPPIAAPPAMPPRGSGRPDPGVWEGLTDEVPRMPDDAGRRGRPLAAGAPPAAAPPVGLVGPPPVGPVGPPPVGPPPGGPVGPVGPPGAPAGPWTGPRPPGATPSQAELLVTTGMIKRAEIRRQLKVAQQLKVATLVVVAMLLLLAYPVYELTKAGVKDPVLGQLDSLNLPDWADLRHDDATAGSRWCINQCRFRQRTWESERRPDETNLAYDTALREAGWRPRTDGICPAVQEGTATCWKRDEYVMDMWVREPVCDLPPPRATTGPRASASPGPTGPAAPPACPGALVTMKIFNAVDYQPVL